LALHSHGSALLSIHPKFPARADRHVIAASASSVEQAADGMRFADVGAEKTTAHAGHSFPHEGSRLIANNGSTSSAATAASGDIDLRSERFAAAVLANLLVTRRRDRRNSAHKFCIALIRHKRV